MKLWKLSGLLLLAAFLAPAANAQYISVSGGGLFPQSLSGTATRGNFVGTARADFDHTSVLAAEAGFGFLPFIGMDVHYSHSKPSLNLQIGDILGSSALADLDSNTVTLDLRVRPPSAFGFRPFAFVGGGFSQFSLEVKNQVAAPFPNGVPGNLYAPVISYGGGFDYKFIPLVGARLELRDDVITNISNKIYQPEGSWHRLAVPVGIVLGR